MAKAYCSDAYRHTAGEGIQIHGGIGFTWEHDMHIYFKRAKSSEVTFGDATWNREIVAQLIGLWVGRSTARRSASGVRRPPCGWSTGRSASSRAPSKTTTPLSPATRRSRRPPS